MHTLQLVSCFVVIILIQMLSLVNSFRAAISRKILLHANRREALYVGVGPKVQSYIEMSKENKLEEALESFRLYRNEKPKRESLVIANIILGMCRKGEHLPYVEELAPHFASTNAYPLHLARIRCYSDKGEIGKALKVLNGLHINQMEARLIQPILAYCWKHSNMDMARDIILFALSVNMNIKTDILADFIVESFRNQCMDDDSICKLTAMILYKAIQSPIFTGIPYQTLQEISARVHNMTMEDVAKKGILVMNLKSLENKEVLRLNTSQGTAEAYDNVYTSYIESAPENTTHPSPTSEGDNEATRILQNYSFRKNISSNMRPMKTLPLARLVEIDDTTGVCPHCLKKLDLLPLTEAEKERAKNEVIKGILGDSSGSTQCDHLAQFDKWLDENRHIEYFIDAANIAYRNQNYDGGKFDFHQVESLANSFREKQIPFCVLIRREYTTGRYRNSIAIRTYRDSKVIDMAPSEMAIINRLKQDGNIYIVPDGIYDDLFWVYATLAARREKVYAVTNDQSRDHRVLFHNSTSFLRWRRQHVLPYYTMWSNAGFNVNVSEPAVYTREIQSQGARLHIPANDRMAWICLNFSGKSTP